jgi:hypothetical protein
MNNRGSRRLLPDLLDEIPGVDWTLAAAITVEMGVDMNNSGKNSVRSIDDASEKCS